MSATRIACVVRRVDSEEKEAMKKTMTCAALCAMFLVPSLASAQSTTFAFDHRGADNLFSFPVNDPMTQTQIGPIMDPLDYAPFAMDFDTAGSTLYVINHLNTAVGLEVGTVNTTTGAYTAGAPITGGLVGTTETGLSVDPTSETFYASNAAELFTLNPVTGVATSVGPFLDGAGAPLGTVIDIAINNSGRMYAHVLGGALWSIDKTTGASTLVGNSGLASNFAQGMDFDPASDLLYAAVYTGGGTGSYGTWNTGDGSFTEILALPSFPDPGSGRELEMAVRIPEPTTLGLIAFGALGLLRRRR
jgi:hypothetical protein